MRARTYNQLDPGFGRRTRWLVAIGSNPLGVAAAITILAIASAAIFAPMIALHNPSELSPSMRLALPNEAFPLGTDAYGRDLLSRILHGGRVSLAIGIGAAVVSTALGLTLGLVSGFFRRVDAAIMRAMDGVMAIPNILLAITVIALWGGNAVAVLIAVTIPEIPRMARIVRSIVLSARDEPYVEAAVALGTSAFTILRRHLMPSTLGPLIVQGTYVCASAILLESMLSFLGVGINPQTPTWGNIMADGRLYFQIRPSMILWPGLLLSLTILSINILGDIARDMLDPRSARRRAIA